MLKFYQIILILFCNSCTTNVFWEDPSKTELNISGYVISENNHASVPIAVWIEELNHHSFTDSSGYFSIPISGTQSSKGNLSGSGKALKAAKYQKNICKSSGIFLKNST